MKKARMNISHSRFILFKLKIFGEIVTTIYFLYLIFSEAVLVNLLTNMKSVRKFVKYLLVKLLFCIKLPAAYYQPQVEKICLSVLC